MRSIQTRWLSTALFCVAFGVAAMACNRAEDRAEVNRDVSAAREEARVDTTDANREAAMTRIEGERKVAKERCDALAGDEQARCNTSADAAYEMAKSRVEGTYKN